MNFSTTGQALTINTNTGLKDSFHSMHSSFTYPCGDPSKTVELTPDPRTGAHTGAFQTRGAKIVVESIHSLSEPTVSFSQRNDFPLRPEGFLIGHVLLKIYAPGLPVRHLILTHFA